MSSKNKEEILDCIPLLHPVLHYLLVTDFT